MYGRLLSAYQVWHPNIPDSAEDYSITVNYAKTEINTVLSRIWITEEGMYSRYKHLITPKLIYDYVEDQPLVTLADQSKVPFGGGIATRRLVRLEIENVFLAKRRHNERTVKLTRQAFVKMRSENVKPRVIRRLETIHNKEFFSVAQFEKEIDLLFGKTLDRNEKKQLSSFLKRGVNHPSNSQTKRPIREGKSAEVARLTFTQMYDVLKEDSDFQAIGAAPKGTETKPGKPLLPLQTQLSFTPDAGFSLNFFNRYHHQEQRVVEHSLGVKVDLSQYNKASVKFSENEYSYITPYGNKVNATSSFSFSNTHQASDEFSFGFSGTVDLNPDSSFRRRLVSDSIFMNYFPDCWAITVRLNERRDMTKTSGGQEREFVDRTLFVNIKLGGVSLPEQTFPATN